MTAALAAFEAEVSAARLSVVELVESVECIESPDLLKEAAARLAAMTEYFRARSELDALMSDVFRARVHIALRAIELGTLKETLNIVGQEAGAAYWLEKWPVSDVDQLVSDFAEKRRHTPDRPWTFAAMRTFYKWREGREQGAESIRRIDDSYDAGQREPAPYLIVEDEAEQLDLIEFDDDEDLADLFAEATQAETLLAVCHGLAVDQPGEYNLRAMMTEASEIVGLSVGDETIMAGAVHQVGGDLNRARWDMDRRLPASLARGDGRRIPTRYAKLKHLIDWIEIRERVARNVESAAARDRKVVQEYAERASNGETLLIDATPDDGPSDDDTEVESP